MKTKTCLLSIMILAAVLVVAGCSSNTSSTVATTASTTSVSGGETTTSTAGVTTTTASGAMSFACADIVSEAKLTQIIGTSVTYKAANPEYSEILGTQTCEFTVSDRLMVANYYKVYSGASYYSGQKLAFSDSQYVSDYHETNKVGTASFDYMISGGGGSFVTFADSSGKYTIILTSGTVSTQTVLGMDTLYSIATEINANTNNIV
ncbi:MAG: hypothetical protein ABIG30_01700 [Candidatus Aenigmatarchaeota archaeon]